jgi:hypothetical protein
MTTKISTGFGIALLLLAFGGAVSLMTSATNQAQAEVVSAQ